MQLNKVFFTITFFLFLYCYDYQEEIILNPDFSGKVFLKYTIPVSKRNQKSYINFLPYLREDFVEFFKIEPIEFSSKLEEGENFDLGFIEATIHFKSLQTLENKLIGLQSIFQVGDTLVLKRKIKNITNLPLENKFYVYFYNLFLDFLKGKSLKFVIRIPKHYNITSNFGGLPYPGILVFQYPLEKTLEPAPSLLWVVSIKSNPFP
ncbi:MAG: hypothetical protein ACK4UJ_09840 [Leptonema sp. (in: bacteria)]